jgi:hypothetical protein
VFAGGSHGSTIGHAQSPVSVFLFVFLGLVIFAGFVIGAGGALIVVAEALFRGEFVAGVGLSDGFDGRSWDDALVAIDILRGDLEGVEHDPGSAVVDAARAEGIEDLSEGDLDGVAVFKDGKPEAIHHSDGRRGVETVKARVEVAVRLVSQSRGFALGSGSRPVAIVMLLELI